MSTTGSVGNGGLRSIPWGKTDIRNNPKADYLVTEKSVFEGENKTIFGIRKGRFILGLLAILTVVSIIIIGTVVATEKSRSSSGYVPNNIKNFNNMETNTISSQRPVTNADAEPQSTNTTSQIPTSTTSSAVQTASTSLPNNILFSLDCAGNKTASIFKAGQTLPYAFTTSCGLDCSGSNIFTFESYNRELCATTCAGRTDNLCGAMVFKYDGTTTNSTRGSDCFLTTSCVPST
ncbi:hypothetical protein B0O99DRAFT_598963 [Bisporella sp. PMI_857]|jgi:hypothetical protein|nr:hypothetical protein B0O99DRAFT_598963 [Bisporella sp. PMI_857]